MKQRRPSSDARGEIKTAVYILVVMLLFLIAFPSFADDEAGTQDPASAEDAMLTEEIQGEISEDAEGTDNENVPEETAEDPGGGEADEGGSAVDKGSGTEEPEKSSQKTKKAVALKAEKGESVSYTAKKEGSNAGETSVFSVTSGGTKYTGSCAKQGVTMKTSGKATITKIGNGTKIAKVIYHYAIAIGDSNWWTSDHKTDKVGTLLGLSSNDATNVTRRRMIEAFCQIYNMGGSDWYDTITNANTGGWTADTAGRVRKYYSDINDMSWYKNLTVPDGFEIWFADAGDAQPFIIWAYTPPAEPEPEPEPEVPEPPAPTPVTGYVTMNKVSADTNITG